MTFEPGPRTTWHKSLAYIDELFAADIVVTGAPMYNFTIPTQLKAWFDRVTPSTMARTALKALLPVGKNAYLAVTRGGVYSPAALLEHQEFYFLPARGSMGLTDATLVVAKGLVMSDEAKAASIAQAKTEITAII